MGMGRASQNTGKNSGAAKKSAAKKSAAKKSTAAAGNKPRGRVENLIPWKPGESGNPGGRPKKKPITEALTAILEAAQGTGKKSGAELLAKVLFAQGLKGQVSAIQEILDRTEGKATTVVHLSGEGVTPIADALAGKSIEELRAMAQAKLEAIDKRRSTK